MASIHRTGTGSAYCDKGTENTLPVCQVGTQKSHRNAVAKNLNCARTPLKLRRGCRFPDVDCDVTWSVIQTAVQYMKIRKFTSAQKFCVIHLACKLMLLLFFDVHGMTLQHWVPCGPTIDGDYYANVLKTQLRGAVRKKRPHLLKKQWFLLQDNAWPHVAVVVLAALTEIIGTALEHPPYSLDLAPYDIWPVPTLKNQLRRKKLSPDEEEKNATAATLKVMSQNSLLHVSKSLKCC